MIHVVTLLVSVWSIEIVIQLKFLSLVSSILKLKRKVTHILLEGKISDHWKEQIIPIYAWKIMKCTIKMLLILLLVLSLFFLVDNHFSNDFLKFVLSLSGFVESVFFGFGYLYLRKSFIK